MERLTEDLLLRILSAAVGRWPGLEEFTAYTLVSKTWCTAATCARLTATYGQGDWFGWRLRSPTTAEQLVAAAGWARRHGQLPALRHVRVCSSSAWVLGSICALSPYIVKLTWEHEHAGAVEPMLGCLTRLEDLHVVLCALEPNPGLADWQPLAPIDALSHLTQLKRLWLETWNQSVLSLAPLEQLSQLEQLNLDGAADLLDMRHVGALTSLRSLTIIDCCSQSQLSSLTRLTGLCVVATPDAGAVGFPVILPELPASLIALELEDALAPNLAPLKHLRRLCISTCGDGYDPARVEQLAALVQTASQLTSLQSLSLESLCLQGGTIQWVSALHSLTSLELRNITELAPSNRLRALPSLARLTISADTIRQLHVPQSLLDQCETREGCYIF